MEHKKVIAIIENKLSENFNAQKKKEIAKKYQQVEVIKKNMKTELGKIENIKVDIGI